MLLQRRVARVLWCCLLGSGCAAPSVPLTPSVASRRTAVVAASPTASASVVARASPPAAPATRASGAPADDLVEPPSADDGFDDLDSGRMTKGDYRDPPAEVTRELAWTEQQFPTLSPFKPLPDFLSIDALVALMPEFERDTARERIHAELEGREEGGLLGAYLDDEQHLLALWIQGNLTQVLAIYEGSRLRAKRVIDRGSPMLAEVLSEPGSPRSEILVERITSMSVCCHPLSLDVYRVGPHGSLSEVLSFPRGHADVGPGVRWSFLNHFDFEDDHLVVTRAFPADSQVRYELFFDKRSGRFQPTPATRKLLREEQRAEDKARDEGLLD